MGKSVSSIEGDPYLLRARLKLNLKLVFSCLPDNHCNAQFCDPDLYPVSSIVHMHLQGTHYPLTKATFCGHGLPIDYYSEQNTVQLSFQSNSGVEGKGFKLRYAFQGCNRNYTGVQGRIYMDQVSAECTLMIRAPDNSTIALYFMSFHQQRSEQCLESSLEVRDGATRQSPPLARLCGYELPNPIFSTGNALLLLLSADSLNYDHLDITYTTTDQVILSMSPSVFCHIFEQAPSDATVQRRGFPRGKVIPGVALSLGLPPQV
ncbi:Cubilin [Zootermopsis nevadensis]|uniref:Cubilin n=1 Tax=Zootermopsis nevadensis TaxID=136037 RepID=A0A067QYC9_ZOONE|nr:Cubilin [Zootermopsis nevadensis]